jgi:hypothetical protein
MLRIDSGGTREVTVTLPPSETHEAIVIEEVFPIPSRAAFRAGPSHTGGHAGRPYFLLLA